MFGLRGCNQRAAICPVVLISALALLIVPASAEVFLTDDDGGVAGQRFGAAAAATGDINADGAWEFLVGAPLDGLSDTGAAFFWYGGRALTVAPDAMWTGDTAFDQFGWSVACVGDVNDGGRDDWAIGAPCGTTSDSEPGYVYLFFGESGLSQTPREIAGEAANDRFGFDIAAAGDFDGDGVDDFIVGAPYNNSGALERGAAYVIYGNSTESSIGLGDALKLTAGTAYAHFGTAVAGVGNFLGSDACVAVGAPEYDSARGTEAGAVWVFDGAPDADATADETIDVGLTRAYSWYGYSLDNAGRWNGDGYDDLVIGAPNDVSNTNNAGRVDIVYGGLSVSSSGDVTVAGQAADDRFGWSVAGVRHVTGSGADDVLIGAPALDSDGLNAGRAYLLAGGSSSATALPVSIMVPARADQAGDEIGYACASAGDFDGDGLWDYAVGAPGGNIFSGAAAGVCRVVDAADMVVRNELTLWDAAWSDEGAVLRFQLAAPAESVRLVRAAGAARTVVWDGPAEPWASLDAPPSDGVLYGLGSSGFAFVDRAAEAAASYELTARTAAGAEIVFTALAGPGAPPPAAATTLEMAPAWPNPFNPTVQIRFRAPAGEALHCSVADVRGRRVRDLYAGTASGDWRTLVWDGRTDDGSSLASGVYFVRLESESATQVQRVVLAK